MNSVGTNAAGLCWCCSSLAVGGVCKALAKLCSNAAALSAPLRNLSALVRSPSRPCVIKRLKLVILYSERHLDTGRQEGCSLPNEYSGKILSPNLNCTLLSSFSKELWAGSDHKGSLPGDVGLLPQERLCFSSASLRLVCLLRYGRH